MNKNCTPKIDEAFKCSRCGICCLHVDLMPGFAHMALTDGRCRHLTIDNLCAIYEERPDMCRTDFVYEKYFSKTLSTDNYNLLIDELCNQLKTILTK
jgi:Fe-S-cluster containining protein